MNGIKALFAVISSQGVGSSMCGSLTTSCSTFTGTVGTMNASEVVVVKIRIVVEIVISIIVASSFPISILGMIC